MSPQEIINKWKDVEYDRKTMRKWLACHGFRQCGTVTNKIAVTDRTIIVKFDVVNSWDGSDHTRAEHLAYARSKGDRKKYIVPTLAYHKGLLIQPFLQNVNEEWETPNDAREIARKFRFSHHWHFGFLDGAIKFFDVDSSGSGWWNWKNRKAKKP